MSSEYSGSVRFVPDRENAEGYFKTGQIAQAIMESGQHKSEVTTRIRHFVQKGYLHPYGRDATDARKSLIFSDDSILSAKILSIATDTGIADKNVYHAISSRLSGWSANEIHPNIDQEEAISLPRPEGFPPTPAAMIFIESYKNPNHLSGWMFRIHWKRNRVSGNTMAECTVWNNTRDTGTKLLRNDDMFQVCELTIPIDEFLPSIIHNIRKARGME